VTGMARSNQWRHFTPEGMNLMVINFQTTMQFDWQAGWDSLLLKVA